MQERIQLKQEEIVGDQTVLNDIYPKTNTNSIDDTNSGVPLNTTLDRMWNSINNKLSRIVNSVNGRTGVVVLNSEDVGLGNVDNVSLADIKNWVITRMQEEFNIKRIELFENLDDVDKQIGIWGDDKLYADKPFYSHHGYKVANSNGLSNDRGYIGYIYWDDSRNKLVHTEKELDTIGSSDSSIIYNEKVDNIDYENSGRIGVNIWKYEDALEVYNRDDSNKSNGGLRINRDKLNQHVYFFEGVYGNGSYDDPDALLYRGDPPVGDFAFKVDIYIDDVLTSYKEDSPSYGGHFNFNGNNYIKQSFRKNDIIICQFSDKNCIDLFYHNTQFKENMNPQLLLNNTCVGQVTEIPDPETFEGKYVIRFYSIKQNLYVGLKEYSLGNYYSVDRGVKRKALGVSLLSTRSDLNHEYSDPVSENNVNESLPSTGSIDPCAPELDTYNISGLNVLQPYDLGHPKKVNVDTDPQNPEWYKKHVNLVTPMGATTNVIDTISQKNADDSSIYLSTNYSMCVIPGFYDIDDSAAKSRNIKNWPASIAKHVDDQYNWDRSGRRRLSYIGLNLDKLIVEHNVADIKESYAINVSGLRIETDEQSLDPNWFNGGYDDTLGENLPHSGGLSVNVGDFLEIGTPSIRYINTHKNDYYDNTSRRTEKSFYDDGKINVRINKDRGLSNDGSNKIAVDLSEVSGWFADNDRLFDHNLIGGGLRFVNPQESDPGSQLNYTKMLNFFDKSDERTYNWFVIGEDNLFDDIANRYPSFQIDEYAEFFRGLLTSISSLETIRALVTYLKSRYIDKKIDPMYENVLYFPDKFDFWQGVAKTISDEIERKCDELVDKLVAENVIRTIINQFQMSNLDADEFHKSFRTLTIEALEIMINYNSDTYPIPKATKGIAVNRGIGLRMSHYRSTNVWTHTDEPETIAVSIVDSAFTTDKPEEKDPEPVYINIPDGDSAPTFVPEEYYSKKEDYIELEVKPYEWNTEYFKFYSKEHVLGAYVHVNSLEVPVWHKGTFFTYDSTTQTYTVQTEPPVDWETNSHHYYTGTYSRILDPPTFEDATQSYGTIYKCSNTTSPPTYVALNSEPNDWKRVYYTYYYQTNGIYKRVNSAHVPTYEPNKFAKQMYDRTTNSIYYVLLTSENEPTNWQDESFFYYYDIEYSLLLDPPPFELNKYYNKNGGEYELLTTEPSNWKIAYYTYYLQEDIDKYNKIPQYIAPTFAEGKYYEQSDDGHGNIVYNLLSGDPPANWNERFFDYFELKEYTTIVKKTEISYVKLTIQDPTPIWIEGKYYSKDGAVMHLTTREPNDWDTTYTNYYTQVTTTKSEQQKGYTYVEVQGVPYCPDFDNDGPFYKLDLVYTPLTDKPINWDDSWTIYYIKLKDHVIPEAEYNMYFDVHDMTNPKCLYGGLRYLYDTDDDISAIGIRISPDKALNGDKTHIGTEALKITDENVLGIQLHQKNNYINPLEITSVRKYVEDIYGKYLYLPCTTIIYPDKLAFPEFGEIDRIYVSTEDGTDFIRYIWNQNTSAYEEMLSYYYDEESLPETGEPNKIYVVGLTGDVKLYTWGHPKTVLFPDSTGSNNISWIDAQDAMSAYAAKSVTRDRSFSYEQLKRLDVDHDNRVTATDSSAIQRFWSLMFKGEYTNDIEGWREYSTNILKIKDPNPEATQYFRFPIDDDTSDEQEKFVPGLNIRYDESAGITTKIASGNYNYIQSLQAGSSSVVFTGEAVGAGALYFKDAIGVKINDKTANTISSITDKKELPYILGGMRFGSDGSIALRINKDNYYNVKTGSGRDILTNGSKGLCIDNDNVVGIKVKESRKDLTIDSEGHLIISNEYRPSYELSLSPFILIDQNKKSIAYNGSQPIEVTLGPGLYISYGDEETGEISEDEAIIRDYSTILESFQSISIIQSIHVIRQLIMNTSIFDEDVHIDTVYFPDFNGTNNIDLEDMQEILAIYADISTGGTEYTEEEKLKADVNHDGIVDAADASIITEFIEAATAGEYTNCKKGWEEFSGYELGIWNAEKYYPDNLGKLESMISVIMEVLRDKLKDEDILPFIVDGMEETDDTHNTPGWKSTQENLLTGIGKVFSGMNLEERIEFCSTYKIPYSDTSSSNEVDNILYYIKNNKTITEAVEIYDDVYEQIPDATEINKYTLLQQRIWANLTMEQAMEFARQGATAGYVKGVTILPEEMEIPFPNVANPEREQLSYDDINMINNSNIPLSDLIMEKCDIDNDGGVWPMIDVMMIQDFIDLCGQGTYSNNVTGWHAYLHDKHYVYQRNELDEYFPYSIFLLKSMVRSIVFAIRTKSSYNRIENIYNDVIKLTPSESSGWNIKLTEFADALTAKFNELGGEYTEQKDAALNSIIDTYGLSDKPNKPTKPSDPADYNNYIAELISWTLNMMLVTVKTIPVLSLIDLYDNFPTI